MKNFLILIFTFIFSCGPAAKEQITDNDLIAFELETLGQQELKLYNFYREVEQMLVNELQVDTGELNNHMQLLINEREIPTPEIYIGTDSGTAIHYVSYEYYKKYRRENLIDTTMNWEVLIETETSSAFDSATKQFNDSIFNYLTKPDR